MAFDGVLSRAAGVLPAGEQAPPLLSNTCCAFGFRLLIWGGIASVLNAATDYALAARFFWTQDLFCLLILMCLLLLFGRFRIPIVADWSVPWLVARPTRTVFVLGCFLAAAIGAAYVLTGGFHLSRDEIMADFDAIVFRSGRLVAPIPSEWSTFRTPLIPDFLSSAPGVVGLVSSYLPGNAALRALVGLAVSPDWTSPLLTGASVVALFRIAQRVWPTRPEPVVVSVLIFATSSQLIVTATTSYAMTAHLAVNLIWLWLFLRDDRVGHTGAIVAGFVGCGLHQVIFHPLFVAPFLVRLWLQRRRNLALCYGAAYMLIGAFWISYPALLVSSSGVSADVRATTPHFLREVAELSARFSLPTSVMLMLDNLLRLAAWQNLFLAPLVFASIGIVRKGEGIARPLVGGVLLTMLVPFVLEPWQGYGWGYRYLHGCLGSLALLAGYGWLAVVAGATCGQQRAARSALGIATAVTILIVLPFQVLEVRSMEAPYRTAMVAIRQAPDDLVFVDPSGMQFARDLVRNDPFLRNRPIVLDLELLRRSEIHNLCERFTVGTFDRQQGNALGIPHLPADLLLPRPKLVRRWALMRSLGCGTPIMVPVSLRARMARQ